MDFRPANAEELKKRVTDAFADAVYPGDHNIAANPDHCDECHDTDEFFRGKHWRELAEANQKLQFGWGGLSFLSPEAWRFFMPAYLLVGLGESEYTAEASDTALFHLSPKWVAQTADLTDYFRERACGFSLEQRKCIAA